MILMHGLFDLNDGVDETDLRQCFERFSEHLKENSLVIGGRFMQHQAHDGFNAREPSTKYYVSIEFKDMDHAERCWAYIEDKNEPLKSLHNAVFSKVRNTVFFLSSDV